MEKDKFIFGPYDPHADEEENECIVCSGPIPEERAGKNTCCELHDLLSYSEEELMRDE